MGTIMFFFWDGFGGEVPETGDPEEIFLPQSRSELFVSRERSSIFGAKARSVLFVAEDPDHRR